MPNQEVHSDYSKTLSPLIQRFLLIRCCSAICRAEWASKRHGCALHGASTDVTRDGQSAPWCAGVQRQNSPVLPPLRRPILLVCIVSGQVIHLGDLVNAQSMLEEGGGEHRACGRVPGME